MQVCGSRCTVAIDSDGQVLSWGWNARATLGHGHRFAAHHPIRPAASPNILPSHCWEYEAWRISICVGAMQK